MITINDLNKVRKNSKTNNYSNTNIINKSIRYKEIKILKNRNYSIFYNQLNQIKYRITKSTRFRYSTMSSVDILCNKNPIKSRVSANNNIENHSKFHSTFPQYDDIIFIPKKVRRYLDKKVKLDELREIDVDTQVAKEKLLLIVSVVSTQLIDKKRYWKRISHKIIQASVRKANDNTHLSGKAVRLLERHNIIEIKKKVDGRDDFEESQYARSFRLTREYFDQHIVEYKLTSDAAILNKQRATQLFDNDVERSSNPIIKNLLHVYQSITLPTVDEIHERAKLLIKRGYSKRGKKLIYLGKKKRDIMRLKKE